MPSETTSINIGLKKLYIVVLLLMNYISYKPLLFAYNLHKTLISNQLVMLRCTTYVRCYAKRRPWGGCVWSIASKHDTVD